MSDTDDVRTISTDKAQYDRAQLIGDGVTVEFELPNSPVYPGSAKVYRNGALQTIVTHYTIDEAVGVVTFVTAPLLNDVIVCTYKHTILSDTDIAMFLTRSTTVLEAAAKALDAIASSEALVQKRITVLGLSTDGPAVAAALRAHAKSLREEAEEVLASTEEGFVVIEQVHEPFGFAERVIKEIQREGA